MRVIATHTAIDTVCRTV